MPESAICKSDGKAFNAATTSQRELAADDGSRKTLPDRRGAESGGITMNRMQSLDVLRGIAVLMVLMHHAPWPASYVTGSFGRLVHIGCHGVDLFFVLSGFLISGLLFHEFKRDRHVDVTRFWLRRGMKIWPSYYAAYGLALVPTLLVKMRAGEPLAAWLRNMLPNLVFLQNYVWPDGRWFASWSLAVEEHFYTLLPLLLLGLIAAVRNLRRVPWLCVGVIVVAPLLRYLDTDPHTTYIQTHLRADGLCYGVLLGYALNFGSSVPRFVARWWPVLLALPCFALLIPYYVPWEEAGMRVFGLTVVSLAFCGLVSVAAVFPDLGQNAVAPVRRLVRVLAAIGVYSYTLYLAQPLVHALMAWWGPIRGVYLGNRLLSLIVRHEVDLTRVVLFVVAVLAAGVILSHLIERPFLTLREKWIPRRKTRRLAG